MRPYTPAGAQRRAMEDHLTRLLLHACSYTPALKRLTRLQVHSGALWKITWKKHRHAILMMAAEMRRPPYPWPQVLPVLTRLFLHACSYTPALTRLLLRNVAPPVSVASGTACSYTLALTRLLLHACSHTPALTKCGAPRIRGRRHWIFKCMCRICP